MPRPRRAPKTRDGKRSASHRAASASRPRLVASSASDQAYHQLHDAIIACDHAPGDRLTESDVADQMDIGKTPAREALRRLVHDGLVVVHPRRGYVVAPVSLRDVEDLCGLRLVVEPAAVALAAGRLDAARTAVLERLCHVGYDVRDRTSVRSFHQANRTFHATIAQACGNPRLAALVDQLLVESQRMIQFGMLLLPHSEDAVHSHEALLTALVRRQALVARRLVEAEIRATQQMVIESIVRGTSLRATTVP